MTCNMPYRILPFRDLHACCQQKHVDSRAMRIDLRSELSQFVCLSKLPSDLHRRILNEHLGATIGPYFFAFFRNASIELRH